MSVLFLAVMPHEDLTGTGGIGLAAFLILMAALPWVDPTKSSRALNLVLLAGAAGAGAAFFHMAADNINMPRQCSGRGIVLCHLENHLYDLGGPYLAAAPMGLAALGIFWAGCVMWKKNRRLSRVA